MDLNQKIIAGLLLAFFLITLARIFRAPLRLALKLLVNTVLGFLAPASFGVYLIHVQPFVFNRWLDESLAWLPALGDWRVLVTVPALALGLYLLCTVLEWGRILIFRLLRTSALERRVGVWLDRFRLPEPEEPAGKP